MAEAHDGPRGESDLTPSERNSYQNLILLCARHHLIVDNDVAAYSVDGLLLLKADHELWVRSQLAPLLVNQVVLERYGQIVDEWAERALLSTWTGWSSYITNPLSPRMASQTWIG